MRIRALLSSLIVVLSFTVALMAVSPAFAAVGGYTVAPPKIENIQVEPGQTMTGVLQLFPGGAGKKFKIEVGSVTQDQNGNYLFAKPTKDPRDTSSWLSVEPTELTSGPGDVEPITWTLKVPKKGAEPGDHLGVIYVTQLGDKPDESGAVVNARIAVRMEITVAGDIVFQPVIENIGVPRLSSDKEVPVSVRISNKGNSLVNLDTANAYMQIKDGDKVQARWRLKGQLFPGSVRQYRFTWKDAPTWGAPKAEVVLDFQDKKKGKVEASQRFYLAPYKLILALILALVGIAVLVTLTLANRKKNGDPDAAGVPTAEDAPEGADDADTAQ